MENQNGFDQNQEQNTTGFEQNQNAYNTAAGATTYATPSYTNLVESKPENFGLGLLGAFLCSLLGGAIYFGVYQIGFVAGICGFLIVALAYWGYQRLSGVKHSTKGLVVSVVMMVVVILLAEFACIATEIYKVLGESYELTFLDAIRNIPLFLEDSTVVSGIAKDLIFSYVFGAIASFTFIKSNIKANSMQNAPQESAILNDYNQGGQA